MVDVVAVQYRSHDDTYGLGIEILDAPVLRSRVASNPRRGFERVDFQCFVFVRAGSYTHVVDFETHELMGGSALVISPGQVHRFGPPTDWEGWILVVDTHLVPDAAREVPTHVRLTDEAADATAESFTRIASDARSSADRQRLGRLLELQTAVLVGRLALGAAGSEPARLIDPTLLSRYRDYRAAVEDAFRRCHLVAPYARSLGCSPRSLNRACRAVGGVSAKQVIVARIVLEAKRILAHADDPVSAISRQLGFDEATNFVKFFRRETGTTPVAFRATVRHGDA